jgi:hypothetical protein
VKIGSVKALENPGRTERRRGREKLEALLQVTCAVVQYCLPGLSDVAC